MSADLLRQCGEALYGSRWQTDLAAALGVSDRTIRRWATDQTSVPRGVYTDLLRMTMERTIVLDDLAERLKEVG